MTVSLQVHFIFKTKKCTLTYRVKCIGLVSGRKSVQSSILNLYNNCIILLISFEAMFETKLMQNNNIHLNNIFSLCVCLVEGLFFAPKQLYHIVVHLVFPGQPIFHPRTAIQTQYF
jgi:hypothetical protein